MNTKINFRVRVMSYAHHIFLTTVISWSDALKKAWQLYRLVAKLRPLRHTCCYFTSHWHE